MRPKPEGCQGCPWFQDGQGFVPDQVIEGSQVFVLGQNPGSEEEKLGQPFVGPTGQMMDTVYLPLAHLRREEVSVGNAVRCRQVLPGGRRTNEMPQGKLLQQVTEHCMREHFKLPQCWTAPGLCQHARHLLVTQGSVALKAVDTTKSVTEWRGFLLPVAGEES